MATYKNVAGKTIRYKSRLRDASEVAHIWAQQNQPDGKSSNCYFQGATIYSYGSHFPMARFVDAKDAQRLTTDKTTRVVLFTTRDYSVSTSKHKNCTRQAIRGTATVVKCTKVASSWGGSLDKRDHESNIADMIARCGELATKIKTARQRADEYKAALASVLHNLDAYCTLFAIRRSKVVKELLSHVGDDGAWRFVAGVTEAEANRLDAARARANAKRARELARQEAERNALYAV